MQYLIIIIIISFFIITVIVMYRCVIAQAVNQIECSTLEPIDMGLTQTVVSAGYQ